MGLISGRKAFQRPMKEGVGLLNAIQDVYLSGRDHDRLRRGGPARSALSARTRRARACQAALQARSR